MIEENSESFGFMIEYLKSKNKPIIDYKVGDLKTWPLVDCLKRWEVLEKKIEDQIDKIIDFESEEINYGKTLTDMIRYGLK